MNDEPEVVKSHAQAPLSADAFLRHWAVAAPDSLALIDSPCRPQLGLGTTRALDFAESNAIVDRIARSFADHGLRPGDIVALQLPNICESPLLAAGAWRAGLVTCTLPIVWRLAEIDAAFGQVAPAAIVSFGKSAVSDNAEIMCEAAAQHMSVRYIFGLGSGLPDGFTPIDDWLRPDSGDGAHRETPPMAPATDAPALLTWATTPSGTFAVPRTHRELIEIGKVFVGLLGFSARDVLLNPYPLATMTAVGGQLAPWLLTGATLALHQPFDFEIFLAQLADQGVTYTAVPAAVIDALNEGGHLGSSGQSLARLGCVWPAAHHARPATTRGEPALPVFDIHNLDELALIVRRREPGTDPALLPLGKLFAPSGGETPTVYLETRVRGSVSKDDGSSTVLKGELLVRGTTVPNGPPAVAGAPAQAALRPDPQGYLDTQIVCSVDETVTEQFRCDRNEGLIRHGGVAVVANELDALYSDFPGFLDAAAFAIADPVMGDRIIAAVVPRPEITPSLDTFRAFLGERQVAGYKFPDQLVVVNAIPRHAHGRILRSQLLEQV